MLSTGPTLHWCSARDLHIWEAVGKTKGPEQDKENDSKCVIYNERIGVALLYARDFLIIFFKYAKSCFKEGVKCSSCPYRTTDNILRCSDEVPIRH